MSTVRSGGHHWTIPTGTCQQTSCLLAAYPRPWHDWVLDSTPGDLGLLSCHMSLLCVPHSPGPTPASPPKEATQVCRLAARSAESQCCLRPRVLCALPPFSKLGQGSWPEGSFSSEGRTITDSPRRKPHRLAPWSS